MAISVLLVAGLVVRSVPSRLCIHFSRRGGARTAKGLAAAVSIREQGPGS